MQISLTWYDYLLQWSLSPDCLAGWNTLVTTIFLPGRAATLSFAENQECARGIFQKTGSHSLGVKSHSLGGRTSAVKRVWLWGRLRFQTEIRSTAIPEVEIYVGQRSTWCFGSTKTQLEVLQLHTHMCKRSLPVSKEFAPMWFQRQRKVIRTGWAEVCPGSKLARYRRAVHTPARFTGATTSVNVSAWARAPRKHSWNYTRKCARAKAEATASVETRRKHFQRPKLNLIQLSVGVTHQMNKSRAFSILVWWSGDNHVTG